MPYSLIPNSPIIYEPIKNEDLNTGDLIFVRHDTMEAKWQRFILSSKYNHVAMIVKDRSGNINVIEAEGVMGVGIYRY